MKIGLKRSALCLVAMALFLQFFSCGVRQSDVEIQDIEHKRSLEYPYNTVFKKASFDGFDVLVQSDMYADKEEILSQIYTIKADIDILWETFDRKETLSVYIVNLSQYECPYVIGTELYCAKQDYGTAPYYQSLLSIFLGTEEPWITYGVAALLYEWTINNDEVANYYNGGGNSNIMGLFCARFSSEWSSEEDIKIAKMTAASLVAYIASQYDIDLILNDLTGEVKDEWARDIGIISGYTYPYEEAVREYKYSYSPTKPIILASESDKYCPLPVEGCMDADELERFLFLDDIGKERILQYINENAPIAFEILELPSASINYHFLPGSLSSSHAIGNDIYLSDSVWAHLHEYTHVLFNRNGKSPVFKSQSLWYYEALGVYLGVYLHPESIFLELLTIYHDEDDFLHAVFDEYASRGSNLEGQNVIDKGVFLDSMAYVSLTDKSGGIHHTRPLYDEFQDYVNVDRYEGNELSYTQACSFISYLINNYSLETVLEINAQTEYRFEEVFDKTYSELKNDWLIYIGV